MDTEIAKKNTYKGQSIIFDFISSTKIDEFKAIFSKNKFLAVASEAKGFNNTPLHLAVRMNIPEIVDYILENYPPAINLPDRLARYPDGLGKNILPEIESRLKQAREAYEHSQKHSPGSDEENKSITRSEKPEVAPLASEIPPKVIEKEEEVKSKEPESVNLSYGF